MDLTELDEAKIRAQLKNQTVHFEMHQCISSTNDRAVTLALDGAPAGLTVLAESQTAGRGRMGRSFYSPQSTGIYMSLILRPAELSHPEKITIAAAVSAALAIENVSGQKTKIKWVNDIFLDNKKVCGILTEGGQMSSGSFWAVLGVGVNLLAPYNDFPAELHEIAGSVLSAGEDGIRERFIALFLDNFLSSYHLYDKEYLYEAYCERDYLNGRKIFITLDGNEYTATAEGITPDFGLILRMQDGSYRTINSGEARVRLNY